ncbi:hypothetical protein IB276_33330 [Ensifer sp. ENS04]|uniref:hypothetical protein n=1 Tax=Ensifer sp. ENS04 TaxID=2769281 RepID=UPI00177D7FB7|nr:hypothetical protein [Ensifer sp. ENS04]MBD9544331.1 hypothetical protein [Ensifer sp. ENS04]
MVISFDVEGEKARLTSELDGQVFVEGKANLNFLTAGVMSDRRLRSGNKKPR